MDKQILANQIIIDCDEAQKDLELGIYDKDLSLAVKRQGQIVDKFCKFLKEKDYEDLELTNMRENPEVYI